MTEQWTKENEHHQATTTAEDVEKRASTSRGAAEDTDQLDQFNNHFQLHDQSPQSTVSLSKELKRRRLPSEVEMNEQSPKSVITASFSAPTTEPVQSIRRTNFVEDIFEGIDGDGHGSAEAVEMTEADKRKKSTPVDEVVEGAHELKESTSVEGSADNLQSTSVDRVDEEDLEAHQLKTAVFGMLSDCVVDAELAHLVDEQPEHGAAVDAYDEEDPDMPSLMDDDDSEVDSDRDMTGVSMVEREGGARVEEDVDGDEDDEDDVNENTAQRPTLPDFTKPPAHRWRAKMALRTREIGGSTRMGADWFAYDFMGSLHVVERLELMNKLENHDGCVNCLSFNGSGCKLASGSDDTNVTIWDWTMGRPLITFDTGHVMNVFQAKFMPLSGDCHMVTCARDGQVRLAELSVRGVCKSTRRLARHTSSAHKLAVDGNSPHVFLSCGEDAVVYQIDLRTAEADKILTVRKNNTGGGKVALYSIHGNPLDSNYFCLCGRDPKLRVYDKRRVTLPVKQFCPHQLVNSPGRDTNITAAVYNYNGTEILASYNDDDIYAFDARHSDGADFTHRYMGHRNSQTVKGVNYYGPKSEFIVSGSDCGHLLLWEHDSQKIVHMQRADDGGVVNVLEPHPYAAVLATSGLDHDVKIWVPSNEDPKLDTGMIDRLTRKNMRLRMRDQAHPDHDADFIYYMLRRIVRRRRRQAVRAEAEEDGDGMGSDESEDEEDGEGIEDGQDDDAIDAPVQCRTS